MKSTSSEDSSNYSVIPKKRFLIILLTIALLLTGAVFTLLIRDIYQSRYVKTETDKIDSRLIVLVTVSLLFSLLAWLAVIRSLFNSHKNLLSGIDEKAQTAEALRQSETRFRQLFENANDIIFTVDLRENFTSLNKAGETATGYTRDEILKMKFPQIVAPESVELVRQMLRSKLGSDAATKYETNIVTKNGSRLTLDVSSRLIVEKGIATGIQGIARDITQSRQAQEDKRKFEQYQNLFKHANDAILIFEPGSETILEVNDRACEMYGRRRKEFVGRSLKEMSQDVSRGSRELEKLLSAGVYEQFESVHLHRNGNPLNLVINAAVIEYQGKPAILTINRDVSHRKQMEEELLAREEHLFAIANSVQDAIVSADIHGNIIFWNDGARKIFGYGEQEITGKPVTLLMPEKYRKVYAKGVRRYTITGKKLGIENAIELRGLRKDGSEFPLELSLGVWESSKGKYFSSVLRDITERKKTENALRENEQKYRELFENANDVLYTLDLTGGFTSLNKAGEQLTGYTREEALQRNIADVIAPTDAARVRDRIAGNVKGAGLPNFELEIIAKDGSIATLDISSRLILQDGVPVGIQGIGRNITERKQTEKALRESEYKLRTLLTNMSEGLLQVDNNERIEYVNDRFCEMTGYKDEELLGKVTFDIIYNDEGRNFVSEANRQRLKGGSGQYELQLRKKSGEMLYMIVGGVPIINAAGEVTGTMGVFTDITERKRAEEQLLHDAFHDGLTGLANRTLFMDHLRMTIERGKRNHHALFAVLFLDFDRFKVINDSLGHTEGDNFLKLVARRLESVLRPGDLLARLGGDEFTILFSELNDENEAVRIAERIQDDLKKPFELGGREIFISASIGITLSTAGHDSAEDMVRDADIAMYRAKSKGRAQHQVFDRVMHEQASNQLQLETEMRHALEREEFIIHYQPIINLKTETLVGFEALVRWKHAERGMIPPFEFIPAAEENGLILPLGAWILRESCRQLRHWQDENSAASHLTVSVNLSSKQFSQFDLAEQIAATLKATRLAPRCLKLEITESHLMENSEAAIKILDRLRALGVELSLDDFGTGYSSLSYLHRLPLHYLKVDRSFVMRMMENEENDEIVSTIIKLAQNLKMQVVAEGIETAEQLAHLKNLNCEFGQGYFFSKPLEAQAAEKYIEENVENFPFNAFSVSGRDILSNRRREN